jgi:hypothetical protein
MVGVYDNWNTLHAGGEPAKQAGFGRVSMHNIGLKAAKHFTNFEQSLQVAQQADVAAKTIDALLAYAG